MPLYTPSLTSYETVLADCATLRDLQIWPVGAKLDPDGWLTNFSGEKKPFALQLLSAFLFFSTELVDQLFFSAFGKISSHLEANSELSSRQAAWVNFLDTVLVTVVEGEEPNISDSGYAFARRARQIVAVPEARLKRPGEVIEMLNQGWRGPVVFVDDFVGSGHQFLTTWARRYQPSMLAPSFHAFELANPGEATFSYCNLIATENGAENISIAAPAVRLVSSNVVSRRYSALVEDSLIWPANMRVSGPRFVRETSLEAGIPNDGGKDDWKGYDGLGLALAFAHSTPDATLPIFHWAGGGWKPLVERN